MPLIGAWNATLENYSPLMWHILTIWVSYWKVLNEIIGPKKIEERSTTPMVGMSRQANQELHMAEGETSCNTKACSHRSTMPELR